MLARLICFLLGHVLEDECVQESERPRVFVSNGTCARCKAPLLEVIDLRDEEEKRER